MKRALYWVSLLSRLALGLIFLAAGALKSVDVAEFARQTAGYGLIGPGPSAAAAPLLIALEFTLAVALLIGWRPRLAAAAIGALLVFFILLEAWGISHGKTESCGCFGAYVPRTPQQVITEDLGFLALALLTCLGPRTWKEGGWKEGRRLPALVVAAAAVLMLGFAVASPRLPIDPLVTSLKVGRTASELKIDHYIPDGGQARTLVALFEVTSPDAKAVSESLNALHDTPGAPAIVALTPSSEQEEAAFLWEAYPAYEIHPVDRGTLKRLYRRLPLYFLVRGGRVERIFEGSRPPGLDLISSGAS